MEALPPTEACTPGIDQDLERLKRMLEPLNKEQLIDIVARTATKYEPLKKEIEGYTQSDPVYRKLFVRGLAWETTSERLRARFSEYGPIEEAVVIKEKHTDKSRGFGFVTFATVDAALDSLKESQKMIDNRLTTCSLDGVGNPAVHPKHLAAVRQSAACVGGGAGAALHQPTDGRDLAARKLFVRGLAWETSSQTLLSTFVTFGEIEEGGVAMDRNTGKSRGYGFVTFRTSESAEQAIQTPPPEIDGRAIQVSLAALGNPNKPFNGVGSNSYGGAVGQQAAVQVASSMHQTQMQQLQQQMQMQQYQMQLLAGQQMEPVGNVFGISGLQSRSMPTAAHVMGVGQAAAIAAMQAGVYMQQPS